MTKVKIIPLVLILVAALALVACSSEKETDNIDIASADAGTTGSSLIASIEPTMTNDMPVHSDADHEATTDDEDSTAGLAGRTSDTGVQELVALPGGDLPPIVVNVRFDSDGISPAEISIPAGRQIQLVLRNSDQKEHHYHIENMPVVGMLWLSKEGEMSGISEVTAEEHDAHHPESQMVPFHVCTSLSGICPSGQWIHAHADPADMDIIIFVAETTGTFEVSDPLNPEVTAIVNVF